MCFSVNQIDDLQSSNKKKSWTFRLPCKSVVFGMAVLFRTILCSSNLGSFIRSCALYKMGLKFLQSYIFEF